MKPIITTNNINSGIEITYTKGTFVKVGLVNSLEEYNSFVINSENESKIDLVAEKARQNKIMVDRAIANALLLTSINTEIAKL